MEINLKEEISKRLGDVIGDMRAATGLLESGKEIFCGRRLQGVQTKLLQLFDITKLLSDDMHVVEETSSECQDGEQPEG